MLALKIFLARTAHRRAGLFFVIKMGTCGTRPPEAASNILGSFIIKKIVKYNHFYASKRPNIFNVLAIASA